MQKKYIILLMTIFFIPINLYSNTFYIGDNYEFKSPNELYLANNKKTITIADGDTIYIANAEYIGQSSLAVWKANNLLIQGIDGRPTMIADGKYIMQKGIWVASGNNIRVENIKFSGARVPDKNGCGIRLDGDGLNLKNCVFFDNQNGILTSNSYKGDVLIENCEFDNGGAGDGYSHNMYIGHIHSFTIKYSYIHHAKVGHLIKSRAENNYILYNRIMDEKTGNSSRCIDLPNGGKSIIIGNLIMQGPNTENSNAIGYGAEGLKNSDNRLYIINNTIVNKAYSTRLISVKEGTKEAIILNNAFIGKGGLLDGDAQMRNNIQIENFEDAYFKDIDNYDYNLTMKSPFIDRGTLPPKINNENLEPLFEYIHPMNSSTRPSDMILDVGAYEFVDNLDIMDWQKNQFVIYPNPSDGKITLINKEHTNIQSIEIYDLLGNTIEETLNPEILNNDYQSYNLSHLPYGEYFIKIKTKNSIIIKTIIIH